jgi:hypothetical protein
MVVLLMQEMFQVEQEDHPQEVVGLEVLVLEDLVVAVVVLKFRGSPSSTHGGAQAVHGEIQI